MSSKLLRQQLKQVLKSEGKTEASLRPEKKLSKKAARKAKKIQQDLNEDKQDKSTYEKNLEYYKQGLLTTLASEKAAAAMQAVSVHTRSILVTLKLHDKQHDVTVARLVWHLPIHTGFLSPPAPALQLLLSKPLRMQIVTRRDPQYAPKDLLYPDTDSKSD